MRRLLFGILLAASSACGGAQREATTSADPSKEDPGFREYAAAHGIKTLNGGGGSDTPPSAADALHLERVDKERPVKLDGVLTEWPALVAASTVERASASKIALNVAIQYDDARLYVGAEVADPTFSSGRDYLSLRLAVPQPGGAFVPYEIEFFAGKPGESEGSVRASRRGAVPGAKIVEAATSNGYTVEASVPWAALPEARTTRVGLHGVVRYVTADGIVSTGSGDAAHPASMPWIPSEPELAMIEGLLAPKGLTKSTPVAELVADLTGDGIRERVAVYEHYLTICGTSYLGGTGFFFRDLVGELVKLEARDVTGRGREDVIVRRTASVGDATREYLEVLSVLDPNAEPSLTFAHEIAIRQSDHRIDNAVHVGRGVIDVRVEPASQWDPASYREPIADDVEPILLPWGPVRAQTWRWDGTRFKKTKEAHQKEATPTEPGSSARAGVPDDSTVAPRPVEPPTPRVERGGDLSTEVLATYRRDRAVASEVRPRFDMRVQVAGDDRPERVLLVGRDLVVLGPGFKEGTGYSFTTLAQFAQPKDITDVSARDLTGDGDADLVVRGVRHARADHGLVDSDLLFVYDVNGETISRIFGIESARAQGTRRVQALVQFVPSPGNKSFDVLAAPGRAFGWTKATYPWSEASPGPGDVEPLLLPWSGTAAVRYAWNGSRFVKSGD